MRTHHPGALKEGLCFWLAPLRPLIPLSVRLRQRARRVIALACNLNFSRAGIAAGVAAILLPRRNRALTWLMRTLFLFVVCHRTLLFGYLGHWIRRFAVSSVPHCCPFGKISQIGQPVSRRMPYTALLSSMWPCHLC